MATKTIYGDSELELGQEAETFAVTNTNKAPFVMRHFPYGDYFDRSAGWLPQVARGVARFMSRLRERQRAFERNIDPRTADELIGEWESAYGITSDESLDIDTRRDQVIAKIRNIGDVTAEYYQQLAVDFGYTDAVVSDAADPFETDSLCDDVLAGGEWMLTFAVTATSIDATKDDLLEQLIEDQLLAGWNTYFVLS